MRLTAIWYHVKNKKPHGHVYRGKHRIVTDPTPKDLRLLYQDLKREEQNMLILRHPYLTVEQSRYYEENFTKRTNWTEVGRAERNQKFQKHFTWADQLEHLRVRDRWE